jgi:hypothetical protein
LASLFNPANNIFVANPLDYVKNVVGRVNQRCQLLGIPRYADARKQTLCVLECGSLRELPLKMKEEATLGPKLMN